MKVLVISGTWTMAVIEVLIAWFVASLSGALMPGPLSAACVMQASRRGKLYGILPMVGHRTTPIEFTMKMIVKHLMILLVYSTIFGIMYILFGGIYQMEKHFVYG